MRDVFQYVRACSRAGDSQREPPAHPNVRATHLGVDNDQLGTRHRTHLDIVHAPHPSGPLIAIHPTPNHIPLFLPRALPPRTPRLRQLLDLLPRLLEVAPGKSLVTQHGDGSQWWLARLRHEIAEGGGTELGERGQLGRAKPLLCRFEAGADGERGGGEGESVSRVEGVVLEREEIGGGRGEVEEREEIGRGGGVEGSAAEQRLCGCGCEGLSGGERSDRAFKRGKRQGDERDRPCSSRTCAGRG